MATLTPVVFPVEPSTETDISASAVPAAAGGDQFANPGPTGFWISNGSGGPITVTFDAQHDCEYGFDHDMAVVVANGFAGFIAIGFDAIRFNSPTTGRVSVSYSGVTSVDVAAVRLPF